MKSLNIVFAGTPAFTLPCLDALFHSKHHLCAVYTQPDRPAGRGRMMHASAVKEWALEHNLPVYQPLNFKDEDTRHTLAALKPDVMVVIAYGLILPQTVLDIPVQGCVNVHASLLPHLRGAAPIQHAILQGDTHTGITIMYMDAGMDTGDILTQRTCTIEPHETSAHLHDKLARLAPEALLHTLDAIAMHQEQRQKQDHKHATYASKINKQDAAISWTHPAKIIDQAIRAYHPWPIAYTHLDGLTLRVHKAHIVDHPTMHHTPGTILEASSHGLFVSTGAGVLCIDEIQSPGGKHLPIADWINSKPSLAGAVFQ